MVQVENLESVFRIEIEQDNVCDRCDVCSCCSALNAVSTILPGSKLTKRIIGPERRLCVDDLVWESQSCL